MRWQVAVSQTEFVAAASRGPVGRSQSRLTQKSRGLPSRLLDVYLSDFIPTRNSHSTRWPTWPMLALGSRSVARTDAAYFCDVGLPPSQLPALNRAARQPTARSPRVQRDAVSLPLDAGACVRSFKVLVCVVQERDERAAQIDEDIAQQLEALTVCISLRTLVINVWFCSGLIKSRLEKRLAALYAQLTAIAIATCVKQAETCCRFQQAKRRSDIAIWVEVCVEAACLVVRSKWRWHRTAHPEPHYTKCSASHCRTFRSADSAHFFHCNICYSRKRFTDLDANSRYSGEPPDWHRNYHGRRFRSPGHSPAISSIDHLPSSYRHASRPATSIYLLRTYFGYTAMAARWLSCPGSPGVYQNDHLHGHTRWHARHNGIPRAA